MEDEYAHLSVCKNSNMSKILSDSLELVNAFGSLGVSKDTRMWKPYGTSGYVPTNPLCQLDCSTVQKFGLGLRDADVNDFKVHG